MIPYPAARLYHERLGLSKPHLFQDGKWYASSFDKQGNRFVADGYTAKTAYLNLGTNFGLAPAKEKQITVRSHLIAPKRKEPAVTVPVKLCVHSP